MKKRSKLFIAPAFIIYTVLMIIPIIGAFGLSFTDWNGISADYDFVGIQNYLSMLSDDRLRNAVTVTLKITVTVVLVVNILGLFIAILLSQAGKLTNIFRSVFFLPYVLSTVAISFIWLAILSYTGVLNSLLEIVGLGDLVNDYIGNAPNAIKSICIIEIWRTLGFHMVLYLASIQTVPRDLYEACIVDGGSKWQQFRYVTLPMIVPGITISVIMSIMTEMKQYDIVKVITNGGPGYSTETITYNIVTQAFGNNMLGYSSAIAVFLFVIIAAISVLQIQLSKKLEV
ncbi:MAG TPA: sugar ABC transporter permease [Candidatus Blautia faecavium]|uniref:Sugar ABC transporter permease n=2 Tax=Blautia TaxID=572511 RepID=A0A9D2DUN7_9FIRM|nr:sugar ABC transporter permease [Candidatus Blautia faecigallinarum]HJB27238.1 sugar ABC transporter permease [Candidatus Blautia faecavium]